MRISLRTALLLILAIAAGLGYYEYKRPRRIPIVAAMAKIHEHELPEFMLRYRDGRRIRKRYGAPTAPSNLCSTPGIAFSLAT